jgi:predicted Fe-Mo cluster-binding NifX family protein
MRIVSTAQIKEPSKEIDPGFGRAGRPVIINTETNDFQPYHNVVNLNAVQKAGI